ncbi:MAG: ComEC/Rec2 family competence protein [Chitinivibrionales bacterium]
MRLPSSRTHPPLFNRSILHQPAFWAWLILSAGILLGDFVSTALSSPRLYHGFWVCAIVFTTALGIILSRSLHWRVLFFIAAGAFAILASKEKNRTYLQENMRGMDRIEQVFISGTPNRASVPLLNIYRTEISAVSLTDSSGTYPLNKKNYRCYSNDSIPQAASVRILGTLRNPAPRYYPGGFDAPRHFRAADMWGTIDADSVQIVGHSNSILRTASRAFRSYIHKLLSLSPDPTQAAILSASFLGEKHHLTEDIKSLFREAGIFHLLAISGLHMGILIISTFLVLSVIPCDRRCKTVATLVVIWSYVLFIGAIPSLVRSAIMASVILTTYLFQRKQYTLNTLGIAGCIWLLFSPHSLFTPGYQLSFGATLSIVAAQPVIRRINHLLPRLPLDMFTRGTLGSFMVSAAGFLGTAPVLHYHFGSLSFVGLVTNVAAVFCMSVGMNLFFIAAGLFWICPALSPFLMKAVSIPLSMVIMLAEKTTTLQQSATLPSVPATVWLLYAICFLCLLSIHPTRIGQYVRWVLPIFFLLSATIMVVDKNAEYAEIVVFNLDGDNMAGIRYPSGKIWLIGVADSRRWEYLYRNRLLPWQRDAGKLEVLVIPRVNNNVSHFLSPLLLNGAPEKLITDGQNDLSPFGSRDLTGLLVTHGVERFLVPSAAMLYPAEECTITVRSPPNKHSGLSVRANVLGARITLESKPSDKPSEALESSDVNIFFNSPTVSLPAFSPQSSLDLKKGAGRLRIGKNGNITIHQFTGERWKRIGEG